MEAGMALAAVKLDNTVKVAAAAKKSPRDITYSLKQIHRVSCGLLFSLDNNALRLFLQHHYN
jgi:hypothetical protein